LSQRILPFAVFLNRFAAPLLLFIFGMGHLPLPRLICNKKPRLAPQPEGHTMYTHTV
jgi:hypothetical protein